MLRMNRNGGAPSRKHSYLFSQFSDPILPLGFVVFFFIRRAPIAYPWTGVRYRDASEMPLQLQPATFMCVRVVVVYSACQFFFDLFISICPELRTFFFVISDF